MKYILLVLALSSQAFALEAAPGDSTKSAAKGFLVTQVLFKSESAYLSSQSKQEVLDLIDVARRKGTVSEVRVLAWPDREHRGAPETPPQKQLSLAAKRGEVIREWIEEKSVKIPVLTFNMSKPPGNSDSLFKVSHEATKSETTSASAENESPAKTLGFKRSLSAAIVMVYIE